MKTNVKTMLKLFLVVLVFGSLVTACKKDKSNDEAQVAVKLTDDPFPFEFVSEANVDITKIELKNDNGEYVTVYSGSHTVNVANYTNGATAEVTVSSIPEGTYNEARVTVGGVTIKLSNNNTFNFNGNGSFETSVAINPEIKVSNGEEVDLLFDMDLSDSVEFSGSFFGGWINNVAQITGISSFNPDLRAVSLDKTGSIEGQVNDNSGNPVAYAEVKVKYDYDNDGTDEDVSTIADANGHYKIIGLPAGIYKIEVDTENSGDADVDNVSVSVQHNTTVDLTVQ